MSLNWASLGGCSPKFLWMQEKKRGIYQIITFKNLQNENVKIMFSELSWTPLLGRLIKSFRKWKSFRCGNAQYFNRNKKKLEKRRTGSFFRWLVTGPPRRSVVSQFSCQQAPLPEVMAPKRQDPFASTWKLMILQAGPTIISVRKCSIL